MIYVNFVIVVVSVLLAILSRKHFSKYKDGKGAKASLNALMLSMGHSVWILLSNVLPLEGLRIKLAGMLRKNQIVSPKRLELITDEFIARCLGLGLMILFTSNLLDFGSSFYTQYLKAKKNFIEREEYGGDVVEEEIYYEAWGKEESLTLSISPVRLTKEEFEGKAKELIEKIQKDYFPQNRVISQDIELPLADETGVFVLSWESDSPEILTSKGRVNDQLEQGIYDVSLRMSIFYYDYNVEHTYGLLVGRDEKTKEQLKEEEIARALNNLEQKAVYDKQLVIPERICDVDVWTKNEEEKGRFLIIGVVFAVVAVGLSISRIREDGKIRDRRLIREYPFFVDSLWLYIEAGMTIKRAMHEYVLGLEDEEGVLARELKYTINQIDNGETEYEAYEALGIRINIPSYISLMRHISQNLKMGTKDLRVLMETEVTMALEAKKENAKRLGEEASTKLVFPMILLLVVVMLMIMTPAFVGF